MLANIICFFGNYFGLIGPLGLWLVVIMMSPFVVFTVFFYKTNLLRLKCKTVEELKADKNKVLPEETLKDNQIENGQNTDNKLDEEPKSTSNVIVV